jgi:hypothetical protein
MRNALVALLLLSGPAQAGLYYSGEAIADLPSQWRGFLPDHRALRMVAAARVTSNSLRESYVADRDRLVKLAAQRPLTADEAADLGALLLRLGNAANALAVLRDAHAKYPDHFHIAANLGTAWQANGDLAQAAVTLREAAKIAPPKQRSAEELHVRLVSLRRGEPKATQRLDNLFDGKPPADAVALVQQLALWLPADGRLLWQLGELANAHGDARTAASILDGCVGEFAMSDPELRRRRATLRAVADEQAKVGHTQHATVTFRSARPLVRRFDVARLPPIRDGAQNALPWAVLTATTMDRQSRPVFHQYLRDLDGKRVALTGYLQPVGDELEAAAFLLIENPVGCWFCEVPEPTGVVLVELPSGKTATLTKSQVKVTGRLVLNATDPENFLYTVRDAAIVPPD